MNSERTPRDPTLDLEARRLFVSAALSTHVLRALRGRIAAESGAEDLLDLARRLGEEADSIERRHRLHFEPSYPGVTAGVESVGGSIRLVLACAAFDRERKQLGVVFTTLIPATAPGVGGASIPSVWGWRSSPVSSGRRTSSSARGRERSFPV